jgi:hypothetical protein
MKIMLPILVIAFFAPNLIAQRGRPGRPTPEFGRVARAPEKGAKWEPPQRVKKTAEPERAKETVRDKSKEPAKTGRTVEKADKWARGQYKDRFNDAAKNTPKTGGNGNVGGNGRGQAGAPPAAPAPRPRPF